MKRVSVFIGLLLLAMSLNPTLAAAGDGSDGLDLSLGAGVGISTSEYKDYDAGISPIPIVNYEGDHFFVRGLTAGLHLFKDDHNEFSLIASYLSQSFDASESDDDAMQELDDRYSTMLAGVSYRLKTDWGVARMSFSADVLDTMDGFVADASYAYPFKLAGLKLSPVIGVQWTSEDYNDYYYGVDSDESLRSGLSAYHPDGALSPYAGLNLKVGLFDDFDMLLGAKAIWLGDEITDSPMVDEDVKYSFTAGFTYSF